jgi:NADH-quinone oxidoreductase subunit N
MPVNFMPSGEDYLRFLPEIIMTVMGTLFMVIEGILGEEDARKGNIFGSLTLATLIAALVAAVYANGLPGKAFPAW